MMRRRWRDVCDGEKEERCLCVMGGEVLVCDGEEEERCLCVMVRRRRRGACM